MNEKGFNIWLIILIPAMFILMVVLWPVYNAFLQIAFEVIDSSPALPWPGLTKLILAFIPFVFVLAFLWFVAGGGTGSGQVPQYGQV